MGKRKKIFIIIMAMAVVGFFVLLLVNRGENTISGKYKNDFSGEVLEIKNNGTFYLDKSLATCPDEQRSFPEIKAGGVTGKWKVDGDNIVFSTGSGAALRGKIVIAGLIMDENRRKWYSLSKNWDETKLTKEELKNVQESFPSNTQWPTSEVIKDDSSTKGGNLDF